MVLRDIETGKIIVPLPAYTVLRKNGREAYLNCVTIREKFVESMESGLPYDDFLDCWAFTVDWEGCHEHIEEKRLPRSLFPNTFRFFNSESKPTIN